MLKARFIVGSLCAVVAAQLVAQESTKAQEAVRIAWKPKVGSTSKHKMSSKSNIGGQESLFGAVTTSKVESIKADGTVVIKGSMSDMTLSFGGQDMSSMIGSAGAGTTITTTYSATGELVARTVTGSAEFDDPRIENAFVILYPGKDLKPGEKWMRKTTGMKDLKIPDSETTYTFVGVETLAEKFKTYKVTYEFKELSGDNPMTAKGTVWLKADDGEMLMSEYSLKNFEIPGMGLTDMTGNIKRIFFEEGK